MTRTLRAGLRGPDVRRWQEFLEAQGHAPGAIDGIFHEGTVAGTVAFQKKHALVPDAIVGPKTFGAAAKLGLTVLRRVTNAELTKALIAEARKILGAHHRDPYGSEFPFEIDGVRYVGRIEEHYHTPGGPRKPWGYHPGVSLFVDTLPPKQNDTPDDQTPDVHAPDDATEPGEVGGGGDGAPLVSLRGTIVIDPGHGGSAPVGGSSPNNAQSPRGVLEKELTLELAKLVQRSVARQATGVLVELTRDSDVNLGLSDRARRARDVRADLFLSIHFNGFDHKARGVETLILPKASGNVNHADDQRFAARVLGAVHDALRALDPGTKNRGVKEQNLGVLRDDLLGNTLANHPCPACLLEVEFLDVPAVDELFNGANATNTRTKVADAIAGALLAELEAG